MARINMHYAELKQSYLFRTIDEKTAQYTKEHPDKRLLRLGIGDVTLPLTSSVIDALHNAVDKQAHKETFRGYLPEVGTPEFRESVVSYYARRGVTLDPSEVFVSAGASSDLGDLLELFSPGIDAVVIEPAYPAYVDANIMSGNNIIHVSSSIDDNFTPAPPANLHADIAYLCSPNNPTGAVFSRSKLQEWIAWAKREQAILIFDAAYEAFITQSDIPHSIFEVEGAKECAIEVCSFSKTAGFTGMRCGYTIIPHDIKFDNASLNGMWVRNRTTKTNGVCVLLQQAARAVLSPEGQQQCRENIGIYQGNAKVLMEALDATGMWYCGGENAPYIWMKCPGGLSSWEFFDLLLQEAQIIGTPGSGFGECGEGYFRLTSFGSCEDTATAAQRLAKVCSTF